MITLLQLELRNEMRQYREYLAEQKKEEEIKEKDLDQLVTEEVEKQWAKRIAHWKKEKEARRRLMEDVLQTRHQQIKEKCMHNNSDGIIIVLFSGGYCYEEERIRRGIKSIGN